MKVRSHPPIQGRSYDPGAAGIFCGRLLKKRSNRCRYLRHPCVGWELLQVPGHIQSDGHFVLHRYGQKRGGSILKSGNVAGIVPVTLISLPCLFSCNGTCLN